MIEWQQGDCCPILTFIWRSDHIWQSPQITEICRSRARLGLSDNLWFYDSVRRDSDSGENRRCKTVNHHDNHRHCKQRTVKICNFAHCWQTMTGAGEDSGGGGGAGPRCVTHTHTRHTHTHTQTHTHTHTHTHTNTNTHTHTQTHT